MIDLNNFYSGGYFLVRANTPYRSQLKIDWQLEDVISLSPCFCPRLDVVWGWHKDNLDAGLEFGIPADKLNEFHQWCIEGHKTDLGLFSAFYSTAAARRFIKRFSPDTSNLYLIGAGLPKELETKAWHETTDEEIIGIEKRIGEHLPMETGGVVLGFEVLSFLYQDFSHSWLCSYIQDDIHQVFGFYPNPYGLIDTHGDAQKVYNWIVEDKQQGYRAEPEPYSLWLLVSYPLVAAHS